ncbi:MAG: phytanoyl-CoA dioxygenase family protein [Chloroflexota bacterium]
MSSNTDLPQPTTDMTQAKADIDQFGFCFIKDALSPEQTAALRTRLVEQAQAEQTQGVAYRDGAPNQNWGSFRGKDGALRKDAFKQASGGPNQRLWMLINKGNQFLELLSHAQMREVIDHVLGDDYLLSSFTANIANPGGVPMKLHTDQWWMPLPIRREPNPVPAGSLSRQKSNWVEPAPPNLIAPVVAVNIMWMLNDFTEENGGTRLVPGSHLSGRRPDHPEDANVESIAAAGPAGTAMVFDGRIWHGTGANVSDGPRLGVLTTFCGPQFRPQENFTLGTKQAVLDEASPDLLALLGFKVWNAYGRLENPVTEFVSRDDELTGELTLA